MLNETQYKAMMNELEALTQWRGSVMKQIPCDNEGFYDRHAAIEVDIAEILVVMEEIGHIEINIRKRVKDLTEGFPVRDLDRKIKHNPTPTTRFCETSKKY